MPTTKWNTVAGIVETSHVSTVTFKLPELSETRNITGEFHVMKQPMEYDMIIGRELLTEIGIDLIFSKNVIRWETSMQK